MFLGLVTVSVPGFITQFPPFFSPFEPKAILGAVESFVVQLKLKGPGIPTEWAHKDSKA